MIVAPVYFRCPLLCNQLLNGLTRSLRPVSLGAGKDFDVVAFSIAPDETPELAGQKKAAYVEQYDRPGSATGWHFLTGDAASIESLAEAIGFRYTFNPTTKLYAHAAGVVIATPDGHIALFLRDRLSSQGAGKRAGPGEGRTHQHADRTIALALLRLRRGDGQVHAFHLAADSDPGNARPRLHWRVSCSSCFAVRESSAA